MAGDEQLPATTQPPPKGLQKIGERGAVLETFDDLWRMADMLVKSGMIPASIDTPAKAAVAIQMGLEAGIAPMTALRGIMVIDGKPSWTGQMALSLLARSGLAVKMPTRRYVGTRDPKKGGLEQFADDFACEVVLHRVHQEPQVVLYSVADDKLQRLWGKKTRAGGETPWTTDPTSMLWWRALGRGMRLVFPDVLNNVPVYEEARDYEEGQGFDRARDVTPSQRPSRSPAVVAAKARDPLLEHFEGASARGSVPRGEEVSAGEASGGPAADAPREGAAAQPRSAAPSPSSADPGPIASENAEETVQAARRALSEAEQDGLFEPGPKGSKAAGPSVTGATTGCSHTHPDGTSAAMPTGPTTDEEPTFACELCHEVL